MQSICSGQKLRGNPFPDATAMSPTANGADYEDGVASMSDVAKDGVASMSDVAKGSTVAVYKQMGDGLC